MNITSRSLYLGMLAMGLSLVASQAATKERAVADGIYKPTSLEAHVTFAGKRLNLPIKAVRDALLRNGVLPVQNQRMPMKRAKWAPVLEKFNFLGIKGDAYVSAPNNLVFKRSKTGKKDRFTGKLRSPLRIRMSGRYKWVPVTVEMRTTLNSTIRDGNFVMDAPLTISVLKFKATGSLRMKAERIPLPPRPQP